MVFTPLFPPCLQYAAMQHECVALHKYCRHALIAWLAARFLVRGAVLKASQALANRRIAG